MTESIKKYTGYTTDTSVFEGIYKSWQDGGNYDPSNSNIYTAIIKLMGAETEISPRKLEEKLKKEGLKVNVLKITKHMNYLTAKHLINPIGSGMDIRYGLAHYGRNFYEWLGEKNSSQSVQPADELNDYQQIFDEILGKWEHNEQLLKDKKYCSSNPFIMALKTIELKMIQENTNFVRRDHILYGLKEKGIDVNFESLSEILNTLTGKHLIREGRPKNKKYVKEYKLENKASDLLSYMKENCKD